jgi:hypothetical protein
MSDSASSWPRTPVRAHMSRLRRCAAAAVAVLTAVLLLPASSLAVSADHAAASRHVHKTQTHHRHAPHRHDRKHRNHRNHRNHRKHRWSRTFGSSARSRTAPETTITSGPASSTTSADASFAFLSSTKNATFQCQVDGGTRLQCSSPGLFKGLAVGNHTFNVRARSSSGTYDPTPATYAWTIASSSPPAGDTTSPSMPTSLTTSGVTQTSVTLAWSPSTDDVGVTGYDALRDGTLAGTTTGTQYTFGGLACGTAYTLAVKARDAAGNSSGTNSVTVSTTACPPPPSGGPAPIAGDFYVSAAAPVGGTGTSSAPFNTVGACAAVVTAGHTCWIKGGTYSPLNVCPKNSGTSDSARVTIAAYPGDSPVLDGGGQSGSAFDCWYKNYLTIRGLEIRNYVAGSTSNHGGFGAAISLLHGLSPMVTRNIVHDIVPSGSLQFAGIVANVNQSGSTALSPVTITSNEVYDIDSAAHTGDCGSGTGVCQGMGIWVPAGDYVGGAVISRNYTHGAGKDGIRVECGTNSTTLTIENNISVHNRNDGIDINNCFAKTSVLVRNNFAGWNGAQGLQPKHTDRVVMANNTVYGSNGFFANGDDPAGTTGNYGNEYGANWNLTLRDNVLVNGSWGGQMTSGAYGLHPAVDYNLYSKITSGLWWIDGVGGFSTLSALRSGTGWEAHGMVADPLFVSTGSGNFALQSGSPAAAASSTGGAIGADPAKLTGVGPAAGYGLSNVPLAQW